jgi:hypothetical protein
MRETRNLFTVLVKKPEYKRPFWWDGNIYTDSEEVGSKMDCVFFFFFA